MVKELLYIGERERDVRFGEYGGVHLSVPDDESLFV